MGKFSGEVIAWRKASSRSIPSRRRDSRFRRYFSRGGRSRGWRRPRPGTAERRARGPRGEARRRPPHRERVPDVRIKIRVRREMRIRPAVRKERPPQQQSIRKGTSRPGRAGRKARRDAPRVQKRSRAGGTRRRDRIRQRRVRRKISAMHSFCGWILPRRRAN